MSRFQIFPWSSLYSYSVQMCWQTIPISCLVVRMFGPGSGVRFWPKVGQNCQNGTDPELFQIRFHNILARLANVQKSDLKSPGFVQFGATLGRNLAW